MGRVKNTDRDNNGRFGYRDFMERINNGYGIVLVHNKKLKILKLKTVIQYLQKTKNEFEIINKTNLDFWNME